MADSAYRNNTTMYLAGEGFLEPIVMKENLEEKDSLPIRTENVDNIILK